MRDFPGVPVGIDEVAVVAAPIGRGGGTTDAATGLDGARQRRVHGFGAFDVDGDAGGARRRRRDPGVGSKRVAAQRASRAPCVAKNVTSPSTDAADDSQPSAR